MDEILQLLGHLTPGELLAEPRSTPSNAYLGLLTVFVVLLVAGIVASARAEQLSRGNRVHRRLLSLYGQWVAWLAGAGIVIVGIRYTNVQLLAKRIWTVLDILALLTVAGYFVWYRIRRYPAEIAEFREEQRKRKYLPVTRRRRR